jgi:hypothetical protein
MPSERQQTAAPASTPEDHQHPQASAESDEPMLHCPVCSQRLISRRCKLICERCGYFMSCADYY